MKASIIITSFNRPRLLSFGLESLANQDFSKDDVEIIVLNDGDSEDGTEGVCDLFSDDLNIKYYCSTRQIKWRVPGFAINHGVKRSTGKYLFISCAEMYHLDNSVERMIRTLESGRKLLTIPSSAKDDNGSFLALLEKGIAPTEKDYGQLENLHNLHLPFFLGVRRDEFVRIGGYDEDFIGFGFDDNDIVHRLKLVGNQHHPVNCRIVHLFHPRLSFGRQDVREKFNYNNRLFRRRYQMPVRNKRGWGDSF